MNKPKTNAQGIILVFISLLLLGAQGHGDSVTSTLVLGVSDVITSSIQALDFVSFMQVSSRWFEDDPRGGSSRRAASWDIGRPADVETSGRLFCWMS